MAAQTDIGWTDSTIKKKRCSRKADSRRSPKHVQARQRVNHLVKTGIIAHPNCLPCKDCGHVWSAGERRHEYDHHLGYEPEHHYDVESVCTTCHAVRDNKKKLKRTACTGMNLPTKTL